MVLRLLSVMYINQTLQVKWKSKISDRVSVVKSVKQGGVLSPILFAIYVNEPLHKLQNSGDIAYAVDLILLTLPVTAFRKLINICELYAAEYHIKCNGSKSKYVLYVGKNMLFLILIY